MLGLNRLQSLKQPFMMNRLQSPAVTNWRIAVHATAASCRTDGQTANCVGCMRPAPGAIPPASQGLEPDACCAGIDETC